MGFWRRRDADDHEPPGSGDPVGRRIAWGGGHRSPAALTAAASKALAGRDPVEALKLAQMATDRNDDFAHSVPGLVERTPLRPVLYHPHLHGIVIDALRTCAAMSVLPEVRLRGAAAKEYDWLDRDWAFIYNFGDRDFWGLYLSDYSQLILLAVEYGGPDLALARQFAEHVRQLRTDSLTAEGAMAQEHLAAIAGLPALPAPLRMLSRPVSCAALPCGELITQQEIRRWLESPSGSEGRFGVRAEALPSYVTDRKRSPLPSRDSEQLKDLAISEGIVPGATRNPDALWHAVDLALYRWELSNSYKEESCQFARDVAYEVYAAQISEQGRDPELWTWRHQVELHRYCYQRLLVLIPTIRPDELPALRSSQAHLNYFAAALYESLRRAGDTQSWHAFAPEIYTLLCSSDPGNLSANQTELLRQLVQRFGPCPGQSGDQAADPTNGLDE